MKSTISLIVVLSFIVSALLSPSSAEAQEVAMIYATNASTANVLSGVDSVLTPKRLAREFSQELKSDLAVRLPQEQARLGVMVQLREAYAHSIREELKVRLPHELKLELYARQDRQFDLSTPDADAQLTAAVLD